MVGVKNMIERNDVIFEEKKIKDCPGIAIQCRGKIVMAEPHPRFTGA